MSTITIGVDLAKSVFSVCEANSMGHMQRPTGKHAITLAAKA